MLRTRMMQAKQDFARLLLGMFAGTTPAFPVTYSYVGQAEAPQGKADVIDVKGPANFAARLFVADNGLPIMLSWQAPAGPAGPGGPGGMAVRVVRRRRGPPPAQAVHRRAVRHRAARRSSRGTRVVRLPERSPLPSSASSSPTTATSTA